MTEPDPLGDMLLESAEAEETERIARRVLEERVASVERKLDTILELLSKQPASPKGNGLKSGKQRFTVTVTGRDESERIETVEIF